MESAAEKYIGFACEIKSLRNDHVGVGLIGDADDTSGSLDIIPHEGDFLPTLPFNHAIKIVCHAPKVGFRLFLGRVYLSSRELMRVVDVGTQQSVERRQYFRINTSLEAEVTRALQGEGSEEKPVPEVFTVGLQDVSLGGIRILTRKLFKPADRFSVSFTLLKQNMEMTCQVCREIFSDNLLKGEHQYGCCFVNVNDKQLDKLCADLFELQRLEIRRRKDKT